MGVCRGRRVGEGQRVSRILRHGSCKLLSNGARAVLDKKELQEMRDPLWKNSASEMRGCKSQVK